MFFRGKKKESFKYPHSKQSDEVGGYENPFSYSAGYRLDRIVSLKYHEEE
jgi:hypothetical protein